MLRGWVTVVNAAPERSNTSDLADPARQVRTCFTAGGRGRIPREVVADVQKRDKEPMTVLFVESATSRLHPALTGMAGNLPIQFAVELFHVPEQARVLRMPDDFIDRKSWLKVIQEVNRRSQQVDGRGNS